MASSMRIMVFRAKEKDSLMLSLGLDVKIRCLTFPFRLLEISAQAKVNRSKTLILLIIDIGCILCERRG
jgi:hypothetical protein